jgi:hypothetical protein
MKEKTQPLLTMYVWSQWNIMLCDKNGQCFSDRKITEKFKILSLSHQTVSRRVRETADCFWHCVVSWLIIWKHCRISFTEEQCSKREHSLHFWKRWTLIMVILPYILTSGSWVWKCLHWSFVPRKEIHLFLQTENLGQEFQRELHDMGFIRSLSFLADLSSRLNLLNFKLQGKVHNVCHLVGHEGFCKKMKLCI